VRILLSIHHPLDESLGAPGATLRLGRALERLGHRIEYLSFDDLPGRMPALAKELLFPEAAAWHIARRARDGVDVVDASTGDAWLWGRLRRRDGPVLVTRAHGLEHRFWDEEVSEAREAGRPLGRRSTLYHGGLRLREVAASLRAADRCVFLNDADREYAVERLGVPRERTAIRFNGVEDAFLGLPAPAADPAPQLTIAMVGSWAERKGARHAAAALGRVLGEREDARALLAGTRVPAGRVHADFPAQVRERVRVVPEYRHDELPGLLEGAQVLLSASLAEGFSLALPEAMACGLAPVATDIPGSRDVVRDGHNGLLVPPRDAEALAVALRRLLDDPALLARLRAEAHATAQAFSWERIARETVELYEEAARQAGGS
jgi:glycosyltransferase involved in cell wall biosynthesis